MEAFRQDLLEAVRAIRDEIHGILANHRASLELYLYGLTQKLIHQELDKATTAIDARCRLTVDNVISGQQNQLDKLVDILRNLPRPDIRVEAPVVNIQPQEILIEPQPIHEQIPEIKIPELRVPDVHVQAPEIKLPAPVVNIQPPQVTVEAPVVHVQMPDIDLPEMKAPDVRIDAPIINVQVPEVKAPDVKVNIQVPEVKAPDVYVEPAQVKVEAPRVQVQIPEGPPPVVHVNVPIRKVRKTIKYDELSRPSVIEEEG